jgi:tetratricopeptide (TPR) repeat protein
LRKGDVKALEQYASELIRLEPGATEGYAFRAGSLIARKQFDAAESDARKAIEVAPQSSVGSFEMGSLSFAEQDFPAAGSWYEQALSHNPNSPDAIEGMANVYLAQKRPDQAIAFVNAQIARSQNNGALYDLLGSIESGKGDLLAAEAALNKAVELNKNNADAIVKLGQVQAAIGNIDQALVTWSQGARDNPQEASFYIASGGVYEQKHDLEKARSCYEKAHNLKPGDPVVANNLAYLLLETNGNLDIALELAQSARRALPESPDVADTLGSVFYRKGIYETAIGMFQEAIRLNTKNKRSENPAFHYHLGQAYEKAEKPALARQHFERVLKIDPNYSDAANIRKQLAEMKS